MSISSILSNAQSVLPASSALASATANANPAQGAQSGFKALLQQVQAGAKGAPATTAVDAASAKLSRMAASHTSATGAARTPHHRHHDGDGDRGRSLSGLSTNVSADGAVASSPTVTAAAAAAVGGGQAASQALAATVQQALQAYGVAQSAGAAASLNI